MVATGPIAASTQTFALGHRRPHAPQPKYLAGRHTFAQKCFFQWGRRPAPNSNTRFLVLTRVRSSHAS